MLPSGKINGHVPANKVTFPTASAALVITAKEQIQMQAQVTLFDPVGRFGLQ